MDLKDPYESLNYPLRKLADMIQRLQKSKLWLKVLIGMALGVITGVLLGPDVGWLEPDRSKVITNWLALPGNLFLKLVKMVVIPLVFSSIIVGILSSGDPAFLRKIGPRLVSYFVFTTVVAIAIGISVAYLIKPGDFVSFDIETPVAEEAELAEAATETSLLDIPTALINILPDNPLEAMVQGEMLSIVIFTIIMGLALMAIDKKHREQMIDLLETVQQVSMIVVRWAMELIPIAVFGLLCQVTSKIGLSALAGLGTYILTVLIGLIILIMFYLVIVGTQSNVGVKHFLSSIRDLQILAFSTSSSAAVMPVSIRTAEDKLKIHPAISQFIVPVGATINMDGTALYQVVATIFLAQVFHVELGLMQVLLVAAITVGASIGAPSAPGVGIVILASILASAGIPQEGIALVLGVDRLVDMCRTVVNVTGDLTACSFFDKQMRDDFTAT